MPPARTRKQVEDDAETDDAVNETVDKKPYNPKEASQWMFFLKDEAVQQDPNVENKPAICELRHPKTDSKALFLFAQEDRLVYEVTQFKEEFRSWLIGDYVQHDGSLYLTTPVDPVFLVLPYLIKVAETGKFMTLDQIVVDETYPECMRLHQTRGLSELHHVTQTRGDDDFKAYKYDKDKTLSWLKLKTEKVSAMLERKNVCVSGSFCPEMAKKNTKDEYLRYAFGIVSDYVPVELGTNLREYLGIPAVSEKRPTDSANPPSKRAKLEDITPTEDYSSNVKPDNKNKAKQSTAQKKLEKVDKSGMKSMMSFFSPKTKTS